MHLLEHSIASRRYFLARYRNIRSGVFRVENLEPQGRCPVICNVCCSLSCERAMRGPPDLAAVEHTLLTLCHGLKADFQTYGPQCIVSEKGLCLALACSLSITSSISTQQAVSPRRDHGRMLCTQISTNQGASEQFGITPSSIL